jgi:hypothetical protein
MVASTPLVAISARIDSMPFIEESFCRRSCVDECLATPDTAGTFPLPHRAAMSKFAEKLKEEFIALLPPTLFFFVALNLIALIRVLMLKGTGIPVSTPVQILVGALVLGKSVLIADLMPFINRYPDKPLAYNVAWKTAIYVLVALVIHYLERLIEFWKEAPGFVAANQKLLEVMVWPHFWAIQIVLVVLIFNYCVVHELSRFIGGAKVREMFFGAPPDART